MTKENHSDAETSRETQKKSGTTGFIKEIGRDVGTDLLHETGATIKWAVGGALIGAAVLGGQYPLVAVPAGHLGRAEDRNPDPQRQRRVRPGHQHIVVPVQDLGLHE